MDYLIKATCIPVIAAIVYGAMALYKYAVNGKASLIRLIPIIAAVLGAVLGVVAFYIVPEIHVADNVYSALFVGAASGLAATGSHQIFKQLSSKDGEKEVVTDENTDNNDENDEKKS
ncbi:MAG: phage holin family protein [Clostridiales bacterium]|nr:phage holin family protein [Clostridiales bacterium]